MNKQNYQKINTNNRIFKKNVKHPQASRKCKLRSHLIPFTIAMMKKNKGGQMLAWIQGKGECLAAFDEDAIRCNLCGNQHRGSSRSWKQIYHMIQLYQSWAYTQRLQNLLQRYLLIHFHCCSTHNSQGIVRAQMPIN